MYQRRLREVFPIAATSNATIRNANPDHKRLPDKRYTATAAKAAKGNASKNWKANMTTKPITNRTISIHKKLGSDKLIPNKRLLKQSSQNSNLQILTIYTVLEY
ncbi:hypothetical protein MUO66_06950 [Candidatus Bathyarchaeota archaeon]|nr:hypothetical protein [Candidatus Bathyarchaeota archaeon]